MKWLQHFLLIFAAGAVLFIPVAWLFSLDVPAGLLGGLISSVFFTERARRRERRKELETWP